MYTRETRIPHLFEVKNYLNNYYTMYNNLTSYRIREELVLPAYMGLRIS